MNKWKIASIITTVVGTVISIVNSKISDYETKEMINQIVDAKIDSYINNK